MPRRHGFYQGAERSIGEERINRRIATELCLHDLDKFDRKEGVSTERKEVVVI